MEEDSYPKIKRGVSAELKAFTERLMKDPNLLKEKNLFAKWKPEANQEIIKETYVLFMKSWLLGMAHTAAPSTDFADILPISVTEFDQALTYEDAIKWAQGRVTMSKEQFYSLSAAMRKKAFTVGRLTQLDAIEKVKSHYLAQLEGKTSSLYDFIKSIREDESLKVAGFGKESPWYYETVYRTNIQTDYNAGRAMEMEENKPEFLEFIGIEDGRQTDICSIRSGTILPYDDPWWEDNWPPLHFNCRSTVRAIYKEEAEVLGLKANPTAPRVVRKTDRVQSGFGANPAKNPSYWKPTPAQLTRMKDAGIQLELDLLD